MLASCLEGLWLSGLDIGLEIYVLLFRTSERVKSYTSKGFLLHAKGCHTNITCFCSFSLLFKKETYNMILNYFLKVDDRLIWVVKSCVSLFPKFWIFLSFPALFEHSFPFVPDEVPRHTASICSKIQAAFSDDWYATLAGNFMHGKRTSWKSWTDLEASV